MSAERHTVTETNGRATVTVEGFPGTTLADVKAVAASTLEGSERLAASGVTEAWHHQKRVGRLAMALAKHVGPPPWPWPKVMTDPGPDRFAIGIGWSSTLYIVAGKWFRRAARTDQETDHG